MPRGWLVLIVGFAASAIGAMPAMAMEFPYCIKGCDFSAGRGDCSFSTYAQCQATAAGRDASCAQNPYFNAKADARTDRRRQSPRRL